MFSIIVKEIKEYFRNPAAVFMTVIFPSLLVFVLGTMLQSLDIADYEIGDIKLQYSVSDANSINATSFETFLTEIDMIKSEKAVSNEAAISLVDKGEIDAYAELTDSGITLHTGLDSVKNRALGSMFNSYNQMSDTYMEIAKVNPAALPELLSEMSDNAEKSYVKQSGLGVTRSMIDYYGVCIIVMMIFMSCITGSSETFKEEQKHNTLNRITVSTVPRISVFFSKVIGLFPQSILIVIITMLCSSLLFGANYCDTIGGNFLLILMLFTAALAASALGTLLGLIMKIPAVSVIMPISWSMLFFSGSFSKEIFFEGFSDKLPPYIIQQAAFDLTLFGDSTNAIIITLICAGIFVVLTALGAVIYSKKKFA